MEETVWQRGPPAGRPAGLHWRFVAPVMAASAVAAVALIAALLACSSALICATAR